MLKGLYLTVKGFFRQKAAENTDLRYAGREHMHNVKQMLEELVQAQQRLEGSAILTRGEIELLEEKNAELEKSVKHWADIGDEDRKKRSYDLYVETANQLHQYRTELATIEQEIADLAAKIEEVRKEANDVEGDLRRAATNQQVGRANAQVESVHKEIRSGALGDAITTAKENTATAQAARDYRKRQSGEDLIVPTPAPGVKTLDELLGK